MKPLRYAIIGSGMMGHEHLRNLALLRDRDALRLNVMAIVDPDDGMRASALSLSQALGFSDTIACTHPAELPTEQVDAFVVVSPNHTHHGVIRALLPLGKPILAEKPLCTTVAHCEDLLRLLQHYPSPFWVAMEYRYMPPMARFLERLAGGEVGRLHMLVIREHRYPFLDKVGAWNRFNANTGGTLVEKCCHHFDLMRLMTGSEPVRIFASGGMDVNHLEERPGGGVPDILDNALVVVDFANGVRASLELCMFCEGAEFQEQLTAIGDKGKLDVYIPAPARFRPTAGEPHAHLVFSPRDRGMPGEDVVKLDPALAAAGDHHGSTFFQHRGFARAILEGAAVQVSAHDGAMAVRMGAAAHESIRTGKAIELPAFGDNIAFPNLTQAGTP